MTETGAAASAKAEISRRFFRRELGGEESLSFETATLLYKISMEILELQPWERLNDDELILVKDPQSGEICRCSVMGALGSVFSVHVYVGDESYRFFRRLLRGESISGGDFYASTRSVSLEFVRASEQTPLDRELLDAMRHPTKRGARGPIFRAIRPGYHPWYLSELEGKQLLHCLAFVFAVCSSAFETNDLRGFWCEEDVFPFVVPLARANGLQTFEVQFQRATEPPPPFVPVAKVQDRQIDEILGKGLVRGGPVEADYFVSLAKIGEKHERKACTRTAFVCDAATGIAYHVDLARPEDSPGDLLVRSLLQAMKTARFVPSEIRVRNKEFKICLGEFAEKLGVAVHVKRSLPQADCFRDGLLSHLGDPGEIPYE